MTVHVVSARIYTGSVYFLSKAISGKLGSWSVDITEGERFDTALEAEQVSIALCTHLQFPKHRSIFDPHVFDGLREHARIIELNIGIVDQTISYRRHCYVDIGAADNQFTGMVLKLIAA